LGRGVAIDESSGSSGTPYDWVRGETERSHTQQVLARVLEQMVDSKPRLAINAFSMGAWATGQNMVQALEKHSTVKSTGPDLDKVLHTLEFFGPRFGSLSLSPGGRRGCCGLQAARLIPGRVLVLAAFDPPRIPAAGPNPLMVPTRRFHQAVASTASVLLKGPQFGERC
jgi:hypothetical protein